MEAVKTHWDILEIIARKMVIHSVVDIPIEGSKFQ